MHSQSSKLVFQDRQLEIYQRGIDLAGPCSLTSVADFEKEAKRILPPAVYDYVAGGAGAEQTLRANLDAFQHHRIVPRMLGDVSRRDLGITIFGDRLPAPVLLGPVGVLSIIHPDAELGAARAAASIGIPYVLSTVSSFCMEDVAQAMGEHTRWFQLYPSKDTELNASLLRRAEQAGYTAVVVTLDTRLLGWRPRDLHHSYLPFLLGEGLANYFSDPVFRAQLAAPPEENPLAAIELWTRIGTNASSTWDELRKLRDQTALPLLVKGVLHPDDARRALDNGAGGVVVSNHGGRQVDGAIASLDALPTITAAVAGRAEILFDSGVRTGADIFKALARGAHAVLIGRPYCWGLAAAGEPGVRDVVLNLLAELDLTVALSGYASIREIDQFAVVPA